MKSAVAIITYNRLNALKTTVDGLVKHCGQYPLAIFDDCSMKDDTKNYLRSLLPDAEEELDRDILAKVRKDDKLKIGLGEYNLGVSAQSNRAIKWFMEETDADHLCICNDDIHVLGDFIAFYAQAHADLNIHFWSFCDFTSEHFRSTDIRITLENEKVYDVRIIQRMTGMMISVTRELINKIGYFDSSFVFGEEHCDFQNRARYAGAMNLNGQMFMSLDLVHQPKKLLTHQKVPSTVSSDDKAAYDEHATAMLTRSMSTLRAGNIYRPFEILNIERVGQVEGYGGINKKAMGSIPVCFDVHGE